MRQEYKEGLKLLVGVVVFGATVYFSDYVVLISIYIAMLFPYSLWIACLFFLIFKSTYKLVKLRRQKQALVTT